MMNRKMVVGAIGIVMFLGVLLVFGDVPTLNYPVYELLDKQSTVVKRGVNMNFTFRNVGYDATMGSVWVIWEKVNHDVSLEGSPPSGSISEAMLEFDVNGDGDEVDVFSLHYIDDSEIEVDGVVADAFVTAEGTIWFDGGLCQVWEKTNFTLGDKTHSLYYVNSTYAEFALDTFFYDHPSPNIAVIIVQNATSLNTAPSANVTSFKLNGTLLPQELWFNWCVYEFDNTRLPAWYVADSYVFPLGFLGNDTVFNIDLSIQGEPGRYWLFTLFNWAPDTAHRYRYTVSDATRIPFIIFFETDLNKDRTVNILDLATVAQVFGTKEGDEYYNPIADLDANDEINVIDLSAVAKDYGKTV